MSKLALLLVPLLPLSITHGQVYLSLHVTTNGSFGSTYHLTDEFGYTNSWRFSLNRAFGGGISVGGGWSAFQLFLGMDILSSRGDVGNVTDINADVKATELLFDLGARIPLVQSKTLTPYLLGTFGLYGLIFATQGGYDVNGVYRPGGQDIDGFHLTAGTGVEIDGWIHLQLLYSRISFSEYETTTNVRVNVGVALWFERQSSISE